MSSKINRVHWRGDSGKRYPYHVLPISERPRKGLIGNFIFARISPHHTWVPIYIGHGDLGNPFWGKPWCSRCIEEREATHMHFRLNPNLFQRKLEAQDLLERYVQVFDPSGCNRHDYDFDPTARNI